MSVRYFEILRDSTHKGNYIPLGRQLPRTPPLTDVKRHLDFSNDDLNVGCEEPHQDIEVHTQIISMPPFTSSNRNIINVDKRSDLLPSYCDNRQVPGTKMIVTKTGRLISALMRQKRV